MQLSDFLTQDADGFIHVTGHRIGLQHLVYYYNEGHSPEMLACEYPTLPLAVIHKIIAFYLENQSEVDAYIFGCQQELERQRQTASRGPNLTELRRRLALTIGPIRAIIALLVFFDFFASYVFADELRVGGAKVNITPKKGEPHYRGKSEGAHDPLFARALVLEHGKVKAGIVVCDVLNVSMDLTGPARKLAAAKTGIPVANLVVAATHTHTSPLHHNDLKDGDVDTYACRVRDAIAEAVVQAQQAARLATLHAGKALQKPAISFNRRFHMKDGSVKFNPGFLNADILRPEGPIDPEVGVLLFRDAKTKKPFASLVNFAMHLDTVGGKLYSADYPYYLHDFFEAEFGKDFVSVFGTGTCGDINHIDVLKSGPQKGHEEGYQTTRYLGGMLAATLKKQLPKLKPDEPALAVRGKTLPLPLQTFTAQELAWAKDDKAAPLIKERPFLQNFRRKKILSLEKLRQKWGDKLPCEVQVIRVGADTALTFLPGEIFVELGISIKNASPFHNTLVIELANDNPAYVPTIRAFDNGDYETINSRLQPGSGEAMVQAAAKMLHHLKDKSK